MGGGDERGVALSAHMMTSGIGVRLQSPREGAMREVWRAYNGASESLLYVCMRREYARN